jgi:hypothetical protein
VVRTSVDLADVDCVTTRVCFAVGRHRYTETRPDPDNTSGTHYLVADRPIVVTRTSQGWREMDFPAIPQDLRWPDSPIAGGLSDISCVARGQRPVTAATTYCVATGNYDARTSDGLDSFEWGRLTAVWNGRSWRLRERPVEPLGIGGPDLRQRVACLAPGSCVALGQVQRPRDVLETFDRWDGSAWRAAKLRDPVGYGGLTDLACSPTCRVVGTGRGPGGSAAPLVLTRRDGRWVVRSPAVPVAPAALSCVDDACVATGLSTSMVKRAGSSRWREVDMPGDASTFGDVSCVDPRWCLAVGTHTGDDRPSGQRYDGRRWSSATPPGPTPLIALDCTSRSACAGISASTVQVWTGRAWHRRGLAVRPFTDPTV